MPAVSNVRVAVAVPFPAYVRGSGPVTVAKQNGVWTVGFTINGFGSQVPAAANYATDFLIGYDSLAQSFFKISLTNLFNGAPINLRSFGATGNGVTDDTAAIQAWLAALAPNQVGYAPAGTYNFSSALSKAANRIAIIGDGPYQTIFNYTGAGTTADLLTFGDGVVGYAGVLLAGFRVASTTTMTAGAAFHFKGLQRSQFRDLVADGQDGNGKLFHGFWFDSADFVRLDGYEAKGQGDGVRVNGGTLGQADLQLRGGKIGACAVGLRIGGKFGGFVIDDTDIIGNGTNVIIDQTLSATVNRELFFGKGVAIDSSSSGPGVSIVEPGTGGFIEFDGTWIASSATHGILVASGVAFRINITGGTIFNNQQDGIRDGTTGGTAVYNINGTKISANGLGGAGFGINALNANPNIGFSGLFFESNTSGDYSANVLTSKLPIYDVSRAWTPGISFGGAAVGVTYTVQVGSYQVVGDWIHLGYFINLSSKGTSNGAAAITGLPATSSNNIGQQATGDVVASCANMAGLTGTMFTDIARAVSVATLLTQGATATAAVADTNFTNTSAFAGQLKYKRTGPAN